MIAGPVATVGKGERKENRRGGGKEKVLWLSKEQPKGCLLTPFPRRSSCFYIRSHTTLYTTTYHHPLALFAISSSDGGIAAARYYHSLIYSYYCCHHYNHHNHPLFLSPQGFLCLARVAEEKLCSIPPFLSFLLSLLLSALSFVRDFMGSADFFLFSLLFLSSPLFKIRNLGSLGGQKRLNLFDIFHDVFLLLNPAAFASRCSTESAFPSRV